MEKEQIVTLATRLREPTVCGKMPSGLELSAAAALEALSRQLAAARAEATHDASMFAAELAESISPSDEWSKDFREGYIFGGRDAARVIRQKYTFPDALRDLKPEKPHD